VITRPRNTEFIVSPQKEQAALQGLIKLCSKLYEDEDASKKGKENKRKVKENLKREKIMGIPREEAKVEKQAEVSSIKEPETKSAPIVATGLPSLQKISEESKVQSMGPNLPPMQMFSNNALYNPALLYSSLFMNHPLSNNIPKHDFKLFIDAKRSDKTRNFTSQASVHSRERRREKSRSIQASNYACWNSTFHSALQKT